MEARGGYENLTYGVCEERGYVYEERGCAGEASTTGEASTVDAMARKRARDAKDAIDTLGDSRMVGSTVEKEVVEGHAQWRDPRMKEK